MVSLCFASQRSPTVCPHCAGSISTIGLRSFLLQVSGVSSHLSFCCTSLVSGFIIHAGASFVHSQTIQRNRQIFVETLKITGKIQQKRSEDRRFCALCPTLDPSCGKPLLQLLAAGSIACGVFRMCPVMSLVATLLFKEPSFGTWVHTWGCNMPMALCWQMLYCGPLSRAIFRLLFRAVKRGGLIPQENPALSFIKWYRQSSVKLGGHMTGIGSIRFLYTGYIKTLQRVYFAPATP